MISSSQINLSWTDNSSDESGFKIERKTGAGGVWSQIDIAGANVTTYPNTGLSGSTTYYYRVRAYGPGGDSGYSNEASATTPAPQPTSMVISPGSLRQGECYTFTVGNGANMTLDVQYSLNGGPSQQINGWPSLNGSGQYVLCTSWQTAVGTYTFVYMRNRLNTNWVPIFAPVTVLSAQPTSFSVSPGTVYQGECYTMAAGNATYMTLDVQYTLNGGPVQTLYGWPNMNQNGQDSICTDQFTALGTYTFVAVRNTLNTDWVPVYAPLTVLPPQPTSFSVYPSVIAQTQCYTMAAGNAASMTLDVQYTFNGGPVQTLYGWPNRPCER